MTRKRARQQHPPAASFVPSPPSSSSAVPLESPTGSGTAEVTSLLADRRCSARSGCTTSGGGPFDGRRSGAARRPVGGCGCEEEGRREGGGAERSTDEIRSSAPGTRRSSRRRGGLRRRTSSSNPLPLLFCIATTMLAIISGKDTASRGMRFSSSGSFLHCSAFSLGIGGGALKKKPLVRPSRSGAAASGRRRQEAAATTTTRLEMATNSRELRFHQRSLAVLGADRSGGGNGGGGSTYRSAALKKPLSEELLNHSSAGTQHHPAVSSSFFGSSLMSTTTSGSEQQQQQQPAFLLTQALFSSVATAVEPLLSNLIVPTGGGGDGYSYGGENGDEGAQTATLPSAQPKSATSSGLKTKNKKVTKAKQAGTKSRRTATATMTATTSTAATSRTVSFTTQRFFSSSSSSTSGIGAEDDVRFDFAAAKAASASSLPPQQGYGKSLKLSDEERKLFSMLREVRAETDLTTTLRVAGGWVRDKLLATDEFQAYHKVFDVAQGGGGSGRLTSKFLANAGGRKSQSTSSSKSSSSTKPSMGRQGTKILVNAPGTEHAQPVDIDIALDDMLGREFADHLNEYLTMHGRDTLSVGVVLKNPEKSKHLETATMKVGPFWIDFVNLRAEEYTQESRIPDLMRIGTASEDAFRRDLTINALFYNINTGQVEDWTGRGFDDLRKGVVATPLPPLTTLLDDPLRVLRSIRFAARLRFTMDHELMGAAMDARVREALAQKVSRERVGGEVDLMLRSPDPVGAMRLLVNLRLVDTVFPVRKYLKEELEAGEEGSKGESSAAAKAAVASRMLFEDGLELLTTAHDHLADCRLSPPVWCSRSRPMFGAHELRLTEDGEARRLLWYAAFLKPLYDRSRRNSQNSNLSRRAGKKAHRSLITKLLVDDLKRPIRDAEAVERILKASDEFTSLMNSGCDISATMILLSDVRVIYHERQHPHRSSGSEAAVVNETPAVANNGEADGSERESRGFLTCSMNGRMIDSATECDPVWEHAMDFRLLCSKMMHRIGPLWRAALSLSISEQLSTLEHEEGSLEYAIQGDIVDESQCERRQGVVERFDAFATAMQQVGLIGLWNEKPVLDGGDVKRILPSIPRGPAFRDVMDEQRNWMTTHPGADAKALERYLRTEFAEYAAATEKTKKKTKSKRRPQESGGSR